METSIKAVLMKRDKMSTEEADDLIAEARAELEQRIAEGDSSADDICEEFFGLEPDYVWDLLGY